MRNFSKKRGLKYFLQSKPVLFLLLVFLVLLAWNTFSLLGKMQESSKNRRLEKEKIVDLEKRKEKLSSDLEKLGTALGKEEVIRENFGMVREGEEVIVIVEDEKINKIDEKTKGGIIDFFKNLFKN